MNRLAVWMVEHPMIRRAMTVMFYAQLACMWALSSADRASASTGAAMVAWTGLHDDYNVPLAAYYVSVVDVTEAMTNNGTQISLNPQSWATWTGAAGSAGILHALVSFTVTTQAAFVVFLLGLALAVLRFVMGSKWLVLLARLGQPILEKIQWLTWKAYLGPTAVAVCIGVAYWHHIRGRTSRAWSMAGTAAIFLVLLLVFFHDPVGDIVSEHGLFGMLRRTGFAIVSDIHAGAHAAGQGIETQVEAMSSHLVTVTARPMVQLQNFGEVIDGINDCGRKWSQAVMAGDAAGPAHAMGACGAHDALAHARQLGANDIGLGIMFDTTAWLISLFVWFVAISTFLVGAKALYFAVVVGPALLIGMMGWTRPKAYAVNSVGQLALHGVQLAIFTVCLALGVTGLDWILSSNLVIVPRLLGAGAASVIGIVMFWWIDRHWYTHSLSTITHTIGGAWTSGRGYVRDEFDAFTDPYRAVVRRGRNGGESVRTDFGRDPVSVDEHSDSPRAAAPPEFDIVKPRSTVVRHTAKKPHRTLSREIVEDAGIAAETLVAPEAEIGELAAAGVVHHVTHARSSTEHVHSHEHWIYEDTEHDPPELLSGREHSAPRAPERVPIPTLRMPVDDVPTYLDSPIRRHVSIDVQDAEPTEFNNPPRPGSQHTNR